ncbi:MAG: hypothetical protein NUV91_08100 [Candidatus Omnitrophica bacterium]|nr:hypothetical protein [Candidatus Omnitrophota bacterium]
MMRNPSYVRSAPRLGHWKMHSNLVNVYYLMKLNWRKGTWDFPRPVTKDEVLKEV